MIRFTPKCLLFLIEQHTVFQKQGKAKKDGKYIKVREVNSHFISNVGNSASDFIDSGNIQMILTDRKIPPLWYNLLNLDMFLLEK